METLRYIREQVGLSQPELSELSGVAQGTISDIELGKRKPRGRTLRKLAQALGVQVADLLVESESLKVQPPLPEFPDERRSTAFDFREAREALEGYCARWEKLLAQGSLDDRAVEEFFVTGEGWIPVLDVALSSEINELEATTGLVWARGGEGSEVLAKSEIGQANQRYLDVFSKIARKLGDDSKSAAAEPNVVRLQEFRERLTNVHRKVG